MCFTQKEPVMGIELMTSSLPRMRSTPELHRLILLSGKRGSNSRPSAWKADALPTELLPHRVMWGEQDSNLRRHRQQIYSLPQLATLVSPQLLCFLFEPIEGFEPTTPRLQITCSGQLSYIGAHESFIAERTAKVDTFFESTKLFYKFFIISLSSSRRDSVSMPQAARWPFCVSCAIKRSGMPTPLMRGASFRGAKYSLTAP